MPSSWPTSKSVQMFGWFSDEIVFASRSKRARNCWFCAKRGGEDLDRDVAPEARVATAIDLAHAAGADGRDDLVRTEAGSG